MNRQETAALAAKDQALAVYRQRAEMCKEIHDQYIRAGFSPDHAMELLNRDLDNIEWAADD